MFQKKTWHHAIQPKPFFSFYFSCLNHISIAGKKKDFQTDPLPILDMPHNIGETKIRGFMEDKHQKILAGIVGMTFTVMVAGEILRHDQDFPWLVLGIPNRSISDHLPEGPPYQDITRMELVKGSVTTATTEIITMHIPPIAL